MSSSSCRLLLSALLLMTVGCSTQPAGKACQPTTLHSEDPNDWYESEPQPAEYLPVFTFNSTRFKLNIEYLEQDKDVFVSGDTRGSSYATIRIKFDHGKTVEMPHPAIGEVFRPQILESGQFLYLLTYHKADIQDVPGSLKYIPVVHAISLTHEVLSAMGPSFISVSFMDDTFNLNWFRLHEFVVGKTDLLQVQSVLKWPDHAFTSQTTTFGKSFRIVNDAHGISLVENQVNKKTN